MIDLILFLNSNFGRIFIDNEPFCFVRCKNVASVPCGFYKLAFGKNLLSNKFPYKTLCKGLVPFIDNNKDFTFGCSSDAFFQLQFYLSKTSWIFAFREFVKYVHTNHISDICVIVM